MIVGGRIKYQAGSRPTAGRTEPGERRVVGARRLAVSTPIVPHRAWQCSSTATTCCTPAAFCRAASGRHAGAGAQGAAQLSGRVARSRPSWPSATVVFDAREAPAGLPRHGRPSRLAGAFCSESGRCRRADRAIDSGRPQPAKAGRRQQRSPLAARRPSGGEPRPIDSDVWYADVLRRRIGRQQAAADVPKPAGPLSQNRSAFWLASSAWHQTNRSPPGPRSALRRRMPRRTRTEAATCRPTRFRPAMPRTCWKNHDRAAGRSE